MNRSYLLTGHFDSLSENVFTYTFHCPSLLQFVCSRRCDSVLNPQDNKSSAREVSVRDHINEVEKKVTLHTRKTPSVYKSYQCVPILKSKRQSPLTERHSNKSLICGYLWRWRLLTCPEEFNSESK